MCVAVAYPVTIAEQLTGWATLALAFFAAVQLWEGWQERRDRKRTAFGALFTDYLRVSSLADALAKEDLVAWAWERAISPDDLLPPNRSTIAGLLGELGPGTAALGAMAYQTLFESAIRLRMLVNGLEPLREKMAKPPEQPVFRTLESQVKNGLKVASEVLDDAMRQPPRWLRLKKKIKIRDPHSELGKELQRQLAAKPGESESGPMADPTSQPWDEEEWLRVQYGMAHHDIWWVKAQQMKAGNWTLLLLAALVGFGKLMHDLPGFTPMPWKGWMFGGLGVLVTLVGASYVWDLYDGLLTSRRRASVIVQPLTHEVFKEVKDAAKRNKRDLVFPCAIIAILIASLALVLWYFHDQWCLSVIAIGCEVPAALLLAGLWRWLSAD